MNQNRSSLGIGPPLVQSGSRFAYQQSNLQNEMQIGAQMRRTTIPHLNPIFEHLKMQIKMKWYISQSVQQLWQISTLKHNLR